LFFGSFDEPSAESQKRRFDTKSPGHQITQNNVYQYVKIDEFWCPVLCIAAPSLKFHIHQAGLIGRWT
jgi:hypothetical protein